MKKTELDFEISKYEDVKNLTENILITTNHSIFASYNLEDKKVYKIGYN